MIEERVESVNFVPRRLLSSYKDTEPLVVDQSAVQIDARSDPEKYSSKRKTSRLDTT